MRNSIPLEKKRWTETSLQGYTVYKTTFRCPIVYFRDYAFLEVKGMSPFTLSLNGNILIASEAGSFQIPLTDTMDPGENEMAIISDALPEVRLLTIPHTHFYLHEDGSPSITCTTRSLEREGTILASAAVQYAGVGDVVTYRLYDPQGTLTDQMDVPAIRDIPAPLSTGKPRFWQGREEPNLYRICARLVSGGKIKDEISFKTGLRSYSILPDGTFFLNGRKTRLHGKIIRQPARKEDLERYVREGYNVIWNRMGRILPGFHTWCDELGLIVIEEATSHLPEQIQRLANHPSVCFWSVPFDTPIQQLQKIQALDPTRLTVMEIQDPCQSDGFSDLCIVNHPDIANFRRQVSQKPLGWIQCGSQEETGLWITFS